MFSRGLDDLTCLTRARPVRIKTRKLPVVLYGWETWSLTEGKGHNPKTFLEERDTGSFITNE